LIKITRSFYNYVYMDASLDEALKVLGELGRVRGFTEDLSDAIRVLKNFRTFYDMLRKRFKEYLAPRKSESDLILGKVVIDKLRLYRVSEEDRVTVVFDKRFELSSLLEVLNSLGLKYELIES